MSNLSEPIRELIRTHVDSVETLELLMLLQRSPDSYWTAAAAEQLLGMRPGTAEKRLDALVAAGLSMRGSQTISYRYSPDDDEKREAVAALAAAYASQRVSVLNLVYSTNLERLKAFSGAFRLKGQS